MIMGILSGLQSVFMAMIQATIVVAPIIASGIFWCLKSAFAVVSQAIIVATPIVLKGLIWCLRKLIVVCNVIVTVAIPITIRWLLRCIESILRRRPTPSVSVVGYTLRCSGTQGLQIRGCGHRCNRRKMACDGSRVLYIGITNDPRAREAEHRSNGKVFDRLHVETRRMNRDNARRWEVRSIANYRRRHGHNPFYNVRDGG